MAPPWSKNVFVYGRMNMILIPQKIKGGVKANFGGASQEGGQLKKPPCITLGWWPKFAEIIYWVLCWWKLLAGSIIFIFLRMDYSPNPYSHWRKYYIMSLRT